MNEWEGEHFKASWRETEETLQASITHQGETVLFTYTPKGRKVEVVFSGQAQQELQEASESEFPPITIEGYPVGPHKYDRDKQHYALTIAHHPNPSDRKEVLYYDLIADGEKAAQMYALRITDTRLPVHATGEDLTRTVRKKRGDGERIIREVRLDSLEVIHGRRDNSTILRQKVRLPPMR